MADASTKVDQTGASSSAAGPDTVPRPDRATSLAEIRANAPAITAIVALSTAVAAQGGYYSTPRIIVSVLAAVAVPLSLVTGRRQASGWLPVVAAATALGAWALVRAAVAGRAAASLPWLATMVCLVAAFLVARRTAVPLVATMVTMGCLIAATGWIGLVWRLRPWAQPVLAVWRATGTLTYANITADLLAMLALLALGFQAARPRSVARATATYLIVVGLGATGSRGGALAFLVGLVVLATLGGLRRTGRNAAPVLVGAVLAVTTLVPSLPAAARGNVPVACAGLVFGWVVCVWWTRIDRRRDWPRVVACACAVTLMLLAGAVAIAAAAPSLGPVGTDRLTSDSYLRTEAARSAARLVAADPVTGVGPGRALFVWPNPDGNLYVTRFVHDEYVQLQVDLGAIGSLLLLCLLAALAMAVLRGRTSPAGRPDRHPLLEATPAGTIWPAAVAGLCAVLVHSGFDFLWHLPAVILCAGLLAGLASSPWGPPTGVTPTKEEL